MYRALIIQISKKINKQCKIKNAQYCIDLIIMANSWLNDLHHVILKLQLKIKICVQTLSQHLHRAVITILS